MTGKPKILIIDGDAAYRRMLRSFLSDEGYDTSEATDGAEAIAAVENKFYDLILMDLKVAGMQGLEALRRIKTLSPPGIPIIIVAANTSAETALIALKYGASDYLSKPVRVSELRILIEKTMKQYD